RCTAPWDSTCSGRESIRRGAARKNCWQLCVPPRGRKIQCCASLLAQVPRTPADQVLPLIGPPRGGGAPWCVQTPQRARHSHGTLTRGRNEIRCAAERQPAACHRTRLRGRRVNCVPPAGAELSRVRLACRPPIRWQLPSRSVIQEVGAANGGKENLAG